MSFSVQGGSGLQTNVGGNVVDLLLNSLGVAVADVQDVVLKLVQVLCTTYFLNALVAALRFVTSAFVYKL